MATKYASRADAAQYLAQTIQVGGSGVWGPVPMPAQHVPAADLQALTQWITEGANP